MRPARWQLGVLLLIGMMACTSRSHDVDVATYPNDIAGCHSATFTGVPDFADNLTLLLQVANHQVIYTLPVGQARENCSAYDAVLREYPSMPNTTGYDDPVIQQLTISRALCERVMCDYRAIVEAGSGDLCSRLPQTVNGINPSLSENGPQTTAFTLRLRDACSKAVTMNTKFLHTDCSTIPNDTKPFMENDALARYCNQQQYHFRASLD